MYTGPILSKHERKRKEKKEKKRRKKKGKEKREKKNGSTGDGLLHKEVTGSNYNEQPHLDNAH
jgi:hypothetical protein